jgi:hypothetical protein
VPSTALTDDDVPSNCCLTTKKSSRLNVWIQILFRFSNYLLLFLWFHLVLMLFYLLSNPTGLLKCWISFKFSSLHSLLCKPCVDWFKSLSFPLHPLEPSFLQELLLCQQFCFRFHGSRPEVSSLATIADKLVIWSETNIVQTIFLGNILFYVFS